MLRLPVQQIGPEVSVYYYFNFEVDGVGLFDSNGLPYKINYTNPTYEENISELSFDAIGASSLNIDSVIYLNKSLLQRIK